MPVLTICQGPQTTQVTFEPGTPVYQVLAQAGIHLAQPCGGRGVCGKCAVELSGGVSAPTPQEQRLGVRLGCQAVLEGDAQIILPVEQPMDVEGGQTRRRRICMPLGSRCGAAVDIGTTTLAVQLYDLRSGECLAAQGMLNPQTSVAADVIGRIDAALKGRLQAQQGQIQSALRTMLQVCAARAEVAAEQIDGLVITGNTTMLHLLTGRSPEALSHAPFEAEHLFGEDAALLGKKAYLPPCLHAFVGADITCAVLASGMCDKGETALLCDVGTNGELALWKDGVLYVTSTAAGPAFEGAGISCGCSSVRGAIDRVWVEDGQVRVHTIGEEVPRGLCGSGLIDAIAALLEEEIIDETGAMEEDYPLTPGVVLTRGDVRAVQLSKAAIAAGIQCLLEAAECGMDEVARVYLAGGFGSHMNLESAAKIGLMPEELIDRVLVVGNAALDGAAALLTDGTLKDAAETIRRCARHVDLGGKPRFNELYMEAMFFGE